MSSLKMTFSLASLVLILGLIAMPVMAQEDMAVCFRLMTMLTRSWLWCYAASRFTLIVGANIGKLVPQFLGVDVATRWYC